MVDEISAFKWALTDDPATNVQANEKRITLVDCERRPGYWHQESMPGLDAEDEALVVKTWREARDYFKEHAALPDEQGEQYGVGVTTGNLHCPVGDSPGLYFTSGSGPTKHVIGLSFPTQHDDPLHAISMQVLMKSLEGARCLIIDLVPMKFNGGTGMMGSLEGPDKVCTHRSD
jgi:hypothetical protein